MEIKKFLGIRIKELRTKKSFTQDVVSEYVGIDRKSLSQIERGEAYPKPENLNKIMEILEVTPFDLFNCEYLAPKEDLLKEMNSAMSNNEELTRSMYKIYKAIK